MIYSTNTETSETNSCYTWRSTNCDRLETGPYILYMHHNSYTMIKFQDVGGGSVCDLFPKITL